MNIFIVYDLDTWLRDLNSGFTLNDCLLGSVKLTKNGNPELLMVLYSICIQNFHCLTVSFVKM